MLTWPDVAMGAAILFFFGFILHRVWGGERVSLADSLPPYPPPTWNSTTETRTEYKAPEISDGRRPPPSTRKDPGVKW